ncbi:MAG: hypothetical protein NVSMB4_03280 [Acidimicrobiales bacterium]
MSRSTRDRTGPAAGIVGVVLYVAGAFAAGTSPKPDAAIGTVMAHYSDHRGAVLAGTLLTLVALPAFLWFLGYLREFVADAEGAPAPLATVTLAAWIALFVIIVGGGIPLTAIVWRGASHVDASLVRLAFDANNLSLYAISATAAATSVLAPSVVIWRRRALPRWLMALALLEVAVNVIEVVGLFSRQGPNAGGYAAGVGPLVWVVWVVALCITLLAHNRALQLEG